MASDHVRVLFTIPACETMEYLVKEWSLGAFAENQMPQITMDIADFAHGIFRGFAEGEISDYDSVEILDQKVIQNGTLGQIFYPKKNFIMEYF